MVRVKCSQKHLKELINLIKSRYLRPSQRITSTKVNPNHWVIDFFLLAKQIINTYIWPCIGILSNKEVCSVIRILACFLETGNSRSLKVYFIQPVFITCIKLSLDEIMLSCRCRIQRLLSVRRTKFRKLFKLPER